MLSGNRGEGNFSTPNSCDVNLRRQVEASRRVFLVWLRRSTRQGETNRVDFESKRGIFRVKVSRGERGEGRFKTVAYLLFLALFIYCGVKLVPPYVAEYQLSDKMQEQARFAVVNRYTEDQIRDNIYKVVQDLDVPAKRDQIKVSSTNQLVKISLEYTVPVDLLFYHVDLHFTPSSENKALF